MPAPRLTRVTLILILAALTAAGCGTTRPATAAPTSGTATADPVTPAAFAGTLVPSHGGTTWPVAAFSASTGHQIRQLTSPQPGVSDLVLGAHGGWIYYAATAPGTAGVLSGVWRVPLAGGPAQLVRAGVSDYALSPDGHLAAYVVTAGHPQQVEIVITNLVTGRRHTIDVGPVQPGYGVGNLAWSPDDTHLAAEIRLAAFASDVTVFDAWTARTGHDGQQASCPGACAAKFPAYLGTGTLTYLTEQLFTATNKIALVSWAHGHLDPLVTVWTGPGQLPIVQGEAVTAQGTALWVLENQAWANGRFSLAAAISRWSGGRLAVVRVLPTVSVTEVPAAYGPAGVAW